MNTDWSLLSYHLATRGIPCEILETMTDDYEFDPWRPAPRTEAVVLIIGKNDASTLASLIALGEA